MQGWPRRFSTVKRLLAYAVLFFLPVLCWRFIDFAALLTKTQNWQAGARLARSGEGTERMFKDLRDKGLLRLDSGTGRIRVEGCELIRRIAVEERESPGRTPNAEDLKNLMRRFCRTDTGYAVREQIALWNSVGATIAVRDDRDRRQPCADGTKPGDGVVSRGCHPSAWRISTGPASGMAAGQAARDAEPPAEVFGLASVDQHPGFGDWLSIETGTARRAAYHIETDVKFAKSGDGKSAHMVRTQVIGKVLRVLVDGAAAWENGAPAASPTAGVEASVDKPLCDYGSHEDFDCGKVPPGQDAPRVDVVKLRFSSPGQRRIAIEVDALRLNPLFLAGLPKETRTGAAIASGSKVEPRYQVGDIGLLCIHDKERERPPHCNVDWRVSGGAFASAKRGAHSAFAVLAGAPSAAYDPGQRFELLSLKEGTIATRLAFKIGVAGWIGATAGDILSLAAAARRAASQGRTADLPLTLDPQLQDYVNEELGKEMDGSRPQRRAAVVMMDADENPGALLAVATWPRIGAKSFDGLHAWDILALDRFRPAQALLASRGWAQTNELNAPGSIFKIVSALALLQSALDRDEATSELIRGLPEAALRSRLGVRECHEDGETFDCAEVGGVSVRNFKKGQFAKHVDYSCSRDSAFEPAPKTFGLRHAIARSDNIWFAAATFAARRSGGSPQAPPFLSHPLAPAIARFYPSREQGGKDFSLMARPFDKVQRLMASPIIADFMTGGPEWRRRLALASYGQTVQASPVAIAAIMAGVATGRRVTPRMQGEAGPSEPLIAGGDAFLNEIRCGMEGVVKAGTAREHVDKSLHGLLRGKTGTADIEGTQLNSVWFAGWLEGEPGTPTPKRIAFSCFVSHASGTGGETCGKLMSRLFVGLRKGDHRARSPAEAAATRPGDAGAAQ